MAAASIAQAITAGFKLIKGLNDSAQYRRSRKAVEAGEKYIQVNQGSGEFNYTMTPEQKDKKLSYYAKRFFKYNQ